MSVSSQAAELVVEVKGGGLLQTQSRISKSSDYELLRSFRAFDKDYVVVRHLAKSGIRSQSALIQQLKQFGASRVEVNHNYQLQMGSRAPKAPSDLSDFSPKPIIPNDKDFTYLWGLLNYGQKISQNGVRKMDSSTAQAWNIFRGSRDVIVGVMDTGVDYKHEDLQGNLWKRFDAKGKAYYGYDAIEDGLDVMDWNGHGTHVAGTIGARGNNGVGVAGVNWEVTIASVRIFNRDGNTSLDIILRGLDWFYQNRDTIKIINHSWGGTGYSQFIFEGFQALDEAGVINVIAAGNNGSHLGNDKSGSYKTMYPAMFDLKHSLAVAAHNNKGQRASFSNYSEEYVHIAAPGVDIRSSVPGSFYDSFSGTSMAAPHVAGAVALLWGMDPSLSARQVKDHLMATGEVTRGLEGVSREAKRLNILNMLQ